MGTHYKFFLWLVLLLLTALLGNAQERVSKTIEESFSLSSDGKLELENKYGNINLTGWNQNKVSVKIEIKVNHRKRSNAEDLLGRIHPKIKSSKGYVSITSEISNKNTGWFADFFNRNNPIDFDRSRVQIDYEVFLPNKLAVKVTNRFGDVLIEDWSGSLNTLIEHGDLWIDQSLNKADIILKFGKIRARNLNYAHINLKNGELDMSNAKSLQLNTSGSEVELSNVNALELYSNKDDIALKRVGTIYGSVKFSTINLEQLGEDADLTMKIADFKVAKIIAPETEISINQESSDINLVVTDFSHRFEATIEQGVVRLPKSFEDVNSQILDKSSRLRKIEASFGKTKKGSISIKGIKGIVTLRD